MFTAGGRRLPGPRPRGLLGILCLLAVLAAPGASARAAEDAGAAEAVSGGGLRPDTDTYYFYRARPYGSESLLHPLRLVVNGGYGILQLQNRDKRLGRIDYSHGLDNVWKNLSDPFGAIQSVGWGEFVQREILPFSFNRGNAQYWPNYMQHLIGGGMSYRLYCEWYRWHGFERPRLMSGLTLFGYHLLNEVVEAENHQGWNVDPVADFYVFNVLGVVVFSSDSVSRFFARTLHMADWSYQPAIDPRDGSIVNNGQNFVWKLDLPWTERWRLFYHWGTHAEGGLSWRVDDEWSLSGGLGLKADELVDLGDGFKTVDLAASAGLFLDRNNSLMASLVMAHTKDYRWRVNLYPGLFDLGPVSPGLFAVDSRTRGAIFGITLDFLPVVPVGLAFSGPADDPTVLSSGW